MKRFTPLTNMKGFSLMELMITVGIIGILVAIGFPSYQSHIQKSRRSDAFSTLLAMQVAQEQFRVSNTSYGSLNDVWGGVSSTPGGYYNLAVSNVTSTGYTLTATTTGAQVGDSEDGVSCNTITLTINSLVETRAPSNCWD